MYVTHDSKSTIVTVTSYNIAIGHAYIASSLDLRHYTKNEKSTTPT